MKRPLYAIVHNAPPPCISTPAYNLLIDIGDWYLFEEGCDFRIYGCSKPPHIFPHYVTDMMLLLEIAYQNLIDGASHTFNINRKSARDASKGRALLSR